MCVCGWVCTYCCCAADFLLVQNSFRGICAFSTDSDHKQRRANRVGAGQAEVAAAEGGRKQHTHPHTNTLIAAHPHLQPPTFVGIIKKIFSTLGKRKSQWKKPATYLGQICETQNGQEPTNLPPPLPPAYPTSLPLSSKLNYN